MPRCGVTASHCHGSSSSSVLPGPDRVFTKGADRSFEGDLVAEASRSGMVEPHEVRCASP
jgi:hypothetical protein